MRVPAVVGRWLPVSIGAVLLGLVIRICWWLEYSGSTTRLAENLSWVGVPGFVVASLLSAQGIHGVSRGAIVFWNVVLWAVLLVGGPWLWSRWREGRLQ